MSEMQDLLVSQGRADRVLHGIPKGEVLALAHASGRLSVLAGQVWMTRANDLDDHFLGAGESIEVGAEARVLVEPSGSVGATVAWQGGGHRIARRLRAAIASARRWLGATGRRAQSGRRRNESRGAGGECRTQSWIASCSARSSSPRGRLCLTGSSAPSSCKASCASS